MSEILNFTFSKDIWHHMFSHRFVQGSHSFAMFATCGQRDDLYQIC